MDDRKPAAVVASDAVEDVSAVFAKALPMIGSFLYLPDLLSCRCVCMEGLNQLHAGMTIEECALHLSERLQARNVVAFDQVDNWKNAGNDAHHVSDCLRSLNTLSTNPLDALIRIMRVLNHLPENLAVLYSGKQGRHCAPCHAETGALDSESYPKCPRGKKKCRTCAFAIPPRSIADRPSLGGIDIHEIHAIQKNPSDPSREPYELDLQTFYCKCVPNIPHNLICPMCRQSDRRTLLLSAFTYQAEASSARHNPGSMPVTFTPSLEQQTKRARTETISFPPEYIETFLPHMPGGTYLLSQVWRADCKHVLSIHCTSCDKFGLLAPARLCTPCRLRETGDGQTVGGVIFRPSAENSARMRCRFCSIAAIHGDTSEDESRSDDDDDEEDDETQSSDHETEHVFEPEADIGSDQEAAYGDDQDSNRDHGYVSGNDYDA
jgi:hypothetical protein